MLQLCEMFATSLAFLPTMDFEKNPCFLGLIGSGRTNVSTVASIAQAQHRDCQPVDTVAAFASFGSFGTCASNQERDMHRWLRNLHGTNLDMYYTPFELEVGIPVGFAWGPIIEKCFDTSQETLSCLLCYYPVFGFQLRCVMKQIRRPCWSLLCCLMRSYMLWQLQGKNRLGETKSKRFPN